MSFKHFAECKNTLRQVKIEHQRALKDATHLAYQIAFEQKDYYEGKEVHTWGNDGCKVFFLAGAADMANEDLEKKWK